MDFTSIAAQIITLITPYLIKGGEEISKSAGKDLWEKIKKVFSNEKDKKVLNDYIDNPADQKNQGKIELKIADKLEIDEEFLNYILDLIKKNDQLKNKMASITINQSHSGAGDNIGRDKIQK